MEPLGRHLYLMLRLLEHLLVALLQTVAVMALVLVLPVAQVGLVAAVGIISKQVALEHLVKAMLAVRRMELAIPLVAVVAVQVLLGCLLQTLLLRKLAEMAVQVLHLT